MLFAVRAAWVTSNRYASGITQCEERRAKGEHGNKANEQFHLRRVNDLSSAKDWTSLMAWLERVTGMFVTRRIKLPLLPMVAVGDPTDHNKKAVF